MAELPDVERWKRHLDATALNREVEDIDLMKPEMLEGVSGQRLRERLKRASFDRTERRGEYLFAKLGKDEWLLLHLGLTGRLACLKGGQATPDDTGFLIRFADGRRVACFGQRSPGRVGLVESPDSFAQQRRLGPDPLLPGLSLAAFRDMLSGRRGPVKAALMDQRFIAGIGNLYSDEMLFQAGIHPAAEARALSGAQTAALYAAMARVLHIAIGRPADRKQPPASWLLPHRTKDGACPRCNARLGQLAVAGHNAYFCPRCQRMGGRRPSAGQGSAGAAPSGSRSGSKRSR